MGLSRKEIKENHSLGQENPDLRVPLSMELDTDGKVRLDRSSIKRDDDGVHYSMIADDEFDYAGYMENLKTEAPDEKEEQK